MTSQERTWAAYGFGYRRKNAKETIDHESSYKNDCEKNFMGNDPGVYVKNAVDLSSRR